MRRRIWPRFLVLLGLAGTLVACDWRANEPVSAYPAGIWDVPGLAEAGPLPEYNLSLTLDVADRRELG